MGALKIALLQLSDQGSLEGNLAHGLNGCRTAAERDIDIALLPEIWSHGNSLIAIG